VVDYAGLSAQSWSSRFELIVVLLFVLARGTSVLRNFYQVTDARPQDKNASFTQKIVRVIRRSHHA
jgi:hypothetical protein